MNFLLHQKKEIRRNKYKPVVHLVIIDVVKHHVLFQLQLIFVCDVFNVSSVSRNFSCN